MSCNYFLVRQYLGSYFLLIILNNSEIYYSGTQVALDTQYWTVWNHITIWGSLVFYFALTFLYNWGFGGSYMGSLSTVMADQTFW